MQIFKENVSRKDFQCTPDSIIYHENAPAQMQNGDKCNTTCRV